MIGTLRLRPTLAVLAALLVLGLALPAGALAAAEFPLEVETLGDGEGTVGCKVAPATTFEECASFEEFASGTSVTLSVQPSAGFGPEEGSVFKGWGGACAGSGTSPTCVVVVSSPGKVVTATFDLQRFKLKVKIVGKGSVECEAEGTVEEECEAEAEYPVGTEVTFRATPGEESELEGWTLEGSEFGAEANCDEPEEAECTLTIEEATTVKATFSLWPQLKIEIKGSGTGTLKCEVEGGFAEACEERYERETELTLVAVYDEGISEFTGWSGACSGKEGCELTMAGPRSVAATFESTVKYTLTIEATGPGTITGSPGSIHCPSTCSDSFRVGTKVTFTATPAAGSLFDGWAGGGCKGIGGCTVTVSGDMTVAAEFEAKPPPEKEDEGLEVEAGTAKAAAIAQVKAGMAALKLSCAGGPCNGTLQLSAKVKQGHKLKSLVAGKAPFRLAAGAKKTIEVKLSGPVKQELAKGKAVKAKLSGIGVASSTVTLEPAKTHKTH